MARGHIAHKGDRWYPVISVGKKPAQRCGACRRRVAWIDVETFEHCPKCGGELSEGLERRQEWHPGHARKRDAQAALTDILSRMDSGTYAPASRETLAEFLRGKWLPSLKTRRSKRGKPLTLGTIDSYSSHCEHHIIPRLGSERLQEITAPMLNRFYGVLLEDGRVDRWSEQRGLSPTTVRRVHATLHLALRDAVRWNLLARNPADQADAPGNDDEREMATWDATELRTFLASVEDDRLYPLWLLYATTGMRRGEALGLRPRDVDLDAGRAEIRQTLVMPGRIGKPKTKRGSRSVPIEPRTVAALRAWRKRQKEERLALGPAYEDCGLFFSREDGHAPRPDYVSKRFDKLVSLAGVQRIRLHDLRHTFCTLALRAGIHPKVVSEIAGHATVSLTLDVYSHAIPAMEAEASAKVAAIVFGEGAR